MTKSPHVTKLIYRLFLFAWIFAVLWVKGHLWFAFTLAAVLLLADGYISVQLEANRAARAEAAKTRSKPGGRRPRKSVDTGGEPPSWREPKPQWSAPPDKGP